jgi:hypothetical protein
MTAVDAVPEERRLLPGPPQRQSFAAAVLTVPRLARFGVSASVRTTRWGAQATVRVTSFVVRAAVSGDSPGAVIDGAIDQVRGALQLHGGATTVEPVSSVIVDHLKPGDTNHQRGADGQLHALTLPQMMDALLDASADVDFQYEGHPAYWRLLNELAPDEARILRLFAANGPQPAIDIRSKRPFGVGSKLLAPGITMIGPYAGLADKTRVPSYLNNLNRLGLIWFSREMLPDEEAYHLLEAQPEIMEAFKGQKIDTVLRSIELTAFGKNLCALCGLMPAAEINARATKHEVTRALPPPDGR